jgi:hypothetical protein
MGNIPPAGAAVYFLTDPPGEWDNSVAYIQGAHLSRAEEYLISLAQDYYATHFNHIAP